MQLASLAISQSRMRLIFDFKTPWCVWWALNFAAARQFHCYHSFSQEGGELPTISFLDNKLNKMSAKMKTFLFFFLCFLDFARSYNVKTKGSKILSGNSDDSGLFGHSVALSQSHAFVGAPHDSTHGRVFKCPLQSSQSQCSPMTSTFENHFWFWCQKLKLYLVFFS